MVPVKRAWIALKPVSKGEPCAIAATGRTRRTVRRAAVGRAHFDRRRRRIWWMEWTRNQRGIWTSPHLKSAAGGANLTRTQSGCPTTSRHSVIPARNISGLWCRDQAEWTFWPESLGEASSGKRPVGEGCGETSKRKGLSWASRRCPRAVWEREII